MEETTRSCLPDLPVTMLSLRNGGSRSEWERNMIVENRYGTCAKKSFKPCGWLSVSGLDAISFCLTSTASHYLSGKMGRFTCNLRVHVFMTNTVVFFFFFHSRTSGLSLLFAVSYLCQIDTWCSPDPRRHKKDNYFFFIHCIFFTSKNSLMTLYCWWFSFTALTQNVYLHYEQPNETDQRWMQLISFKRDEDKKALSCDG